MEKKLFGNICFTRLVKALMLPKFQASVGFIEKKEGRSALITSFDTLKDALKGKTGTVIE